LDKMPKILCISFIILCCFFSQKCLAQDPDTLLCINTKLNGDVELIWKPATNQCACGSFVGYNIYYSSTGIAGPFVLLTTINNAATNTYLHAGANGSSNTYFYYIETVCNCGGTVTTVTSIVDNQLPATPVIEFISVIGNQVNLNWLPSASPETFAYVIYYFNGTTYVAIDTVYGLNNTSYTNTTFDPTLGSVAFTVAAMDRCNTVGLFNTNPQQTIKLNASQDRCNNSVLLAWNNYINWLPAVFEYQIFESINGSGFTLKTTVSAPLTSTAITGLVDGNVYDYYVVAIQSIGGPVVNQSNSTVVNFVANNILLPAYNHIDNVSVVNNEVGLNFLYDNAADLLNLVLQHSTDKINYSTIANFSPTSSNTINYIHQIGNVSDAINYYRFYLIDSCNVSYPFTEGQTILLTGVTNTNNTASLSFSPFFMNLATIADYEIMRSNNGSSFMPIAKINTFSFLDDLNSFGADTGMVCYKVKANYTSAFNFVTTPNVSYSNKWCASPFSEVYMANSVFPNGLNKTIKPIIPFPNFKNYSFKVFNKYGQIIFNSIDYTEYWNAIYQNVPVEQGNYTYKIEFEKPDGQKFLKQGNIMVIY
jgi:hypothetical protein